MDPDGEFAFAVVALAAAGFWAMDAIMPKSTDVSNSKGFLDHADNATMVAPVGAGIKTTQSIFKVANSSISKAALNKGAKFFKKFAKRNAYDHNARQLGNFTEFSVKVPGNKSGYTNWVKTVNSEGKTVRMHHDTFDNTGKFLHRSVKKPGPNRHIYRNGKKKKD